MEKGLRKFIEAVRPRNTRELVQDHVRRVEVTRGEVLLHVDKRYAFNLINSSGHVENVIASVKRAFGKEARTVIQLDKNAAGREREKAVPHAIHYS